VKVRVSIAVLVVVLALAFVGLTAVQGARADGWCMAHSPRAATGFGVDWAWAPPHWECVYTQWDGEGKPIREIGRLRAFSK
jgi:hypothetical protein